MRPSLNALLCLPAICLPMAAQDASPVETESLVKEAIAATGKPVKGASRLSIVKYLQAKYGKTRCFDTPISEGGIVGVAD